MKTYKLFCEGKDEEYPVQKIGDYNPYVEYFVFDNKNKNVFIIRSIEYKICMINLFSFTVGVISQNDFKNLPKLYEVYRLPHFTGGCCDYDAKSQQIEQEERKKMFEKILNFMKEEN